MNLQQRAELFLVLWVSLHELMENSLYELRVSETPLSLACANTIAYHWFPPDEDSRQVLWQIQAVAPGEIEFLERFVAAKYTENSIDFDYIWCVGLERAASLVEELSPEHVRIREIRHLLEFSRENTDTRSRAASAQLVDINSALQQLPDFYAVLCDTWSSCVNAVAQSRSS